MLLTYIDFFFFYLFKPLQTFILCSHSDYSIEFKDFTSLCILLTYSLPFSVSFSLMMDYFLTWINILIMR